MIDGFELIDDSVDFREALLVGGAKILAPGVLSDGTQQRFVQVLGRVDNPPAEKVLDFHLGCTDAHRMNLKAA